MQEEVTVNQNQPPVAGESDAAGGGRRHLQTLRRWGAKGSLLLYERYRPVSMLLGGLAD